MGANIDWAQRACVVETSKFNWIFYEVQEPEEINRLIPTSNWKKSNYKYVRNDGDLIWKYSTLDYINKICLTVFIVWIKY